MARQDLTAERVRHLFNYDKDTGILTRRVSTWGKGKAGLQVGFPSNHGYLLVGVDYHLHLVHRLAWLYVEGEWPAEQVDHKNGIRTDNRWCNLRAATHSENQQNQRRPQRNNKSGFMGVHRRGDYFIARIKVDNKQIYLGWFKTGEEAEQCYIEAKRKYHRLCDI